MKVCLTPPVAAKGAWLIAGRSAAGAVLLAVTVSACSGGSASSTPSIFTPTAPASGQASSTHSGTRTPSPSGGASTSAKASSAGASASRSPATSTPRPSASASSRPASSRPASSRPASAAPTVTRTVVVTQTPVVTYTTRYPAAAPETGGGGTAGLQDGVLFGVGGAAVLAGLGSLAYRRRVTRKLADPRRPAPRDPADREPADR
jgi:hypothetical protein